MVRPYAVPDLPVLTGTQSAEFDRRSIVDQGVPEAALMERAGSGAASLVRHLIPEGPVLVLAGKGNNGGDALVVARCLAAWGRSVEVLLTAPRPARDPLLHGWDLRVRGSGDLDDGALRKFMEEVLGRPGAVVDGVLGTGIQGAPRGEAARVLSALDQLTHPGCAARVVALDVPSGVDADAGAVPGPAVRAHVTVSFGWPKLGTLLHPGRARSGRIVALEIGFPPFPPDLEAARALTPAWAAVHRPVRAPVTHKNAVGALALVAGAPGMAGAAVLAGRAALRAGAGFVRVVTHPANREIVQAALPEAVYVDAGDEAAVDRALEASTAVAVGPGMGTDEAAADLLRQVLASGLPRVLDADALTLLASGGPVHPPRLQGAGTLLTPHPGEARRLLGPGGPDPVTERLDAVRALRLNTGASILLKGTPSLVLGDRGLLVDTVGTSDLAAAGMGDVLTGTIGAFLAAGSAPADAGGLGLVHTGRAADRAGKGAGLQSADVPEHLPDALREGGGSTDLPVPGILLDLDPAR